MNKNLKKIIVILGPTASGKTGLAVKMAQKFNGEIVSADSRQVYRGMDVGTGKDLEEYSFVYKGKKIKIPYHLIDVVSPMTEFNLAKYQKLAYKAIDDILSRGKTPIIVGGTGLYLQALVDGYRLADVKADKQTRRRLELMTIDSLLQKLKKLNPTKAELLNNSDKRNKRRLVRYIELAINKTENNISEKKYNTFIVGLTWPRDILQDRIYKRLTDRLEKEGMIEEIKSLHKKGVSWKRLYNFGLEYKYISLYSRGQLSYEDMVEKLNIAIRQFAKRQMSWFRRWERQGVKINWIKNKKEIEKQVKKFLK